MAPVPNRSEFFNGQHTALVDCEIPAALSPLTVCVTPTSLSARVEPLAPLNIGESVLLPSTDTGSVSSDTGKEQTLAQPSHVLIPPMGPLKDTSVKAAHVQEVNMQTAVPVTGLAHCDTQQQPTKADSQVQTPLESGCDKSVNCDLIAIYRTS